jgi:hypothetical protein
MTGLVISILCLAAVVFATSSMRRQGKITPGTQRALIGIVGLIAVVVAVLEWLNRSGG